MVGRFPGAPDLDALWRNVRDGVESITFFGDEQLQAAGVDAQTLKSPNYVKARGVQGLFLELNNRVIIAGVIEELDLPNECFGDAPVIFHFRR